MSDIFFGSSHHPAKKADKYAKVPHTHKNNT